MYKKTVAALALPLLLQAHTLHELFAALKTHPQTLRDETAVRQARIAQDKANAALYPKIDLFGSYDNYSTPTGMVPLPPNELFTMIKDPRTPQPFAYNIYRIGASLSMPVFVQSIFTFAKKAEAMQRSARAKKRINRIKNQAVIVGADADLLYLDALNKAIEGKARSLRATQKTLKIKVANGRAPASALYKLDDSLNQVAITKNSIALQRQKLLAQIERLTGIRLDAPVPLKQIGSFKAGDFAALEPLRRKIEADRLDLEAHKERLYPSLVARGNYVRSYGEAYNNDKSVYESYGSIGAVLNIPIVHMDRYADIDEAKIALSADEIELQKRLDELRADAEALETSLPLLENSITLYRKSIDNKRRLLRIAKLNYKTGRLSTEEYLRYEDDVVEAEARLYKARAQKWQTLMQLAVIYANPIEEIIE